MMKRMQAMAALIAAGAALASPCLGAQMPGVQGELVVHIEGLRSARGMVRACLTRDPALYLHCDKDPAALKASVTAHGDVRMDFAAVPPGDYVLAVIHDENGNAKVDTFLGIPREGVGFSRNPPMKMGPPKYEAARFHVASGANEMDVTLKYFL